MFDNEHLSLAGLPDALPTPRMMGRHLLEALYFIETNSIVLQYMSPRNEGSMSVEPMLDFDGLSFEEKNLVLKQILAAHNVEGLRRDEIDKLKALRLLTKNNGESFAMVECTGTVQF